MLFPRIAHTLGCLAAASLTSLAFSATCLAATPPDLSRMVVIGDSLAAGFQNYSLYDSYGVLPGTPVPPAGGQRFGFAAQLAQQAGVNLQLPLISYPGIPPALTLNADGTLEREDTYGTREPQTLPVQTRDLAVPGFRVADVLLYTVPESSLSTPTAASGEDLLTAEVLGFPSLADPTNIAGSCGVLPLPNGNIEFSQVACAAKLHPSVVVASVGNEDALQAVVDGVVPTKAADFEAAYALTVFSLRLTGAQVVVSNIPDVTALPILVSYAQFSAECGAAPKGATPGDFVVPALSTSATSFDLCSDYAVRPASLIAQAKAAVQQYNQIIASVAATFGATVVDAHGMFAQLAASGYTVNGHKLTTQYLGGLFSLDGVHPTNTGYALLANVYIAAINKSLHASIPLVSVSAVAASDPLIF